MSRTLLKDFDRYRAQRGFATRSEAVRHLIQNALVDDLWIHEHGHVAGAVILIYDHHKAGLSEALLELQHQYCSCILASTHVHLNVHECLEVVILRGPTTTVREVADRLLTLRGIRHGRVVITTPVARAT